MSESRLRIACAPAPASAGDLLDAFDASAESDRFYLERPGRGEAVLGLGAAATLEHAGSDRFTALGRQARRLWQTVRMESAPPAAFAPRLVGGFAFDAEATPSPVWDGFPRARLVLPSLLAVRRGAETWCSRARSEAAPTAPPEWPNASSGVADSETSDRDAEALDRPEYRIRPDCSPAAYTRRVAEAVRAIQRGEFEKVVVARSCLIECSRTFDVRRVLGALRARHPSGTLFAVARGEAVFVGATPEQLVHLEGDRVAAAALAGSAPQGRTPEEERAFARRLRESKKDQEEHAIVARAVRSALSGPCVDIAAPEAPGLLCADGIQHLHTPFRARLCDPQRVQVLELAGALHPTPAVGGAPRGPALDWLRRNEALDRGWYAGAIGSAGISGGGDWSVALRCALIRGGRAWLFAGAGIVAESDPEAELAETRLKFAPMLGALLEP